MFVVSESAVEYVAKKPIVCSKCRKGKLGSIPAHSKAVLSRRGGPPPDKKAECLQVKCAVCGALWTLTIE